MVNQLQVDFCVALSMIYCAVKILPDANSFATGSHVYYKLNVEMTEAI